MKLRKDKDTTGEVEDKARHDVTSVRTSEDKATELAAPGPGAGPDSPTQSKARGVFAALRRTFKQFSEDNVTDWAAALTYYGVLSIFPGLLVLVSILGLLGDDGRQTVQDTVNEIAPSQIKDLLTQVLR